MKIHLKTFSGSLIAGLILITLLGYLFIVERDGSREIRTPKTLFPEVQKRQINSITLKYPDREITLKMDGNKWFVIRDSDKLAVDADSVGNLLDEISEIEISKIAADITSSLDDFGLDSPRLEVMLKAPSDEYRFSAGSETPVGVGTYVKVGAEQRVLVVDKHFLQPLLDKTENDFRDKPK